MIEVVGRAAETAEEAVVAALERTISRAGAKARHHVSRMARAKGARPGPSHSPQAKSSGSGSTRTRRRLGSGAHISIETPLCKMEASGGHRSRAACCERGP